MRRALAALWLVAAVAMPASVAGASAPDAYGYWSKTAPVPPPGVPEGGLYVALGPYTPDPTAPPDPNYPPPPTEPAAVAALRFTVPEGAGATMTLKVAGGSATNPDGTPVAIDACQPDVSAGAWQPPATSPGAFAERPKHSCSAVSAASSVDTAAGTVTWNLPGSFQLTTGVLDVVLVPTGTAPFQVAFAKPDESTLVASEAPAPPPTNDAAPAPETPVGDLGTELAVDAPVADFGIGSTGVVLPTPTTTPTRPRATANRPEVGFRPASRPVAAVDDRADRIFAVSVLFAIVAALWWVGGQQVNAPRLLGSLGVRRGAVESGGPAPAAPIGGVGRFARPRPSRPPRI